jgi:hypothetical protein
MRYFILLTAMILIGQSCHQKKSIKLVQGAEDLTSEAPVDTLIKMSIRPLPDSVRKKLIDSAILHGNKEAYSKVANSEAFLGPDLLFQALIMANKYNDPRASFDVYFMLCEEGYNSLSLDLGTLDKRTKAIGLYYLLKSYELGFDDAKATIKEMYTDKNLPVPKSSDFVVFK